MMHLLIDVAWQTTALLAVGLVLSVTLAKQPARAHVVLALVVVAALAVPLASGLARHQGWGWLPAPTTSAPTPMIASAVRNDATLRDVASARLDEPERAAPPSGAGAAPPLPVHDADPPRSRSHAAITLPGPSMLLFAWGLLTIPVAATILLRMRRETRLIRRAPTLDDPRTRAAAVRAASRTGMLAAPVLRRAPVGTGVSIWCWSRPATVLLAPDVLAHANDDALADVLCHELAHARRRDHWWTLLAHALVVALPWHPLA